MTISDPQPAQPHAQWITTRAEQATSLVFNPSEHPEAYRNTQTLIASLMREVYAKGHDAGFAEGLLHARAALPSHVMTAHGAQYAAQQTLAQNGASATQPVSQEKTNVV